MGAHRSLPLAAFIALLALAGCGGSSGSSATSSTTATVPGGADPAAVKVIEGWANSLRRGDIDSAAGYFALPSVAENGVIVRIDTADQAKLFNASLPCGARVTRAVTAGRFTTATFRLTERSGPGSGGCGPGVGQTAQTSFVIRDGKIVQWRRVGRGSGSGQAESQSA